MPNYNAMIAELNEELKRLVAQNEQLQNRITAILKAVDTIQILALESDEPIIYPELPPIESGFTNKVRAVLRANPAKALTAVEIRDVLLKSEPKADSKVMLIHTHNTVKRLKRQEEIEPVFESEGRVAYRWKSPPSKPFSLADFAESMGSMGSIDAKALAGFPSLNVGTLADLLGAQAKAEKATRIEQIKKDKESKK